MKIAIVHDYIKEYGGAERVLEALHEIWPDAPVFTTVYLPNFLGPHKERFKDWDIKSSFLQYIPFKEKLISPIRLIAPFVFKTFNLSRFDVVIVSATGAYSPNVISEKRKATLRLRSGRESEKPVYICYCHTPPRYLYGFATAREWKNNVIFRVLGSITNHFLRLIDFKSAQNVDFFIANSKNVAGRIKKFYRKDSTVIYPPVELDDRKLKIENSNLKMEGRSSTNKSYYLAGGRIARPKHIDLIIKTFEKLDLPLKVFGKVFAGASNILISKHPNIQFLGEVRDEEKIELMGQAKAYIFASEDEDFGITPVEAMSVGTPVIAYRSGGLVESIVHGRTGLFFDELSVESLSAAIKQFSNLTIESSDCIKQAQKFSKERFKREIKQFVENHVK